MRTLVHLSDLHFGRVDAELIYPLLTHVNRIEPDLVVVSGDLTQRARRWQFRQARKFLDAIAFPQLIVPGNHDVPLYNVFARFLAPLRSYRRFIRREIEPTFINEELAVFGLNSARSLTFAEGRINERQVARLRRQLSDLPEHLTRVIVCHHPFDLPPGAEEKRRVGGAQRAMEMLAECRVDMVLSGHFHISHTGHTIERFRAAGHSFLLIHSGTATSTRRRGESNAFNVIRINRPEIEVQRYWWNLEAREFEQVLVEQFRLAPSGWAAVTTSGDRQGAIASPDSRWASSLKYGRNS